jgi:electron transport complex protein RnfG
MTNFFHNQKIVFQTILVMLIFGLVFALVLSIFYEKTNPVILKSEAEAKKRMLLSLIESIEHDNDVEQDFFEIKPNALLGNKKASKAYRVKNGEELNAIILETRAPDGYSGDIFLLVAINKQSEIITTRVIKHQETPGLGDYIDIEKNPWINIFKETSLGNPSEKLWAVKKDNGDFDYISGATITPRAVIKALKNTLLFFESNKNTLGFNNV